MGVGNVALGVYDYLPATFAGFFAIVASGFTFLMVWRPGNRFAYRIGGTFAVGMLFLRVVSLVLVLLSVDRLSFWLAISSIGSTMLLTALYGHWWLTEVGPWHDAHRLGIPMQDVGHPGR